MKNLHIRTFGCQMNEYDSQKMLNLLQKTHGLKSCDHPEQADVILVNTCSIREKAQEKLFHQLGRYKSLKLKKPNLIIGVGGCVASQEGEQIFKRASYVDIVFGPQTLHKLPEMIENVQLKKHRQLDISFPKIEKFDHLPIQKESHYHAYLTIMEGCSKYCTFCVVPYTRGEEISRPLDDVLKEAKILVEQGVREITLLGQNVNAYRSVEDELEINFAFLLECLSDIPELKRIRFTTSHPIEFSNQLIDAFKKLPKLASFVHLPVQSGSDRVLAQMKRKHTALEYMHVIKALKKARPDIQISSDFIVGFPGETDDDFKLTMDLINQIKFDRSFSFIYSPRPGTPASFLSDQTPIEEKSKRLKILQNRLQVLASQITQNMLGTCQRVLVEGFHEKENRFWGRSDHGRMVFLEKKGDWFGQLMNVEITQVHKNQLYAKPL